MRTAERGSIGKFFSTTLVLLLVLGLGAVVVYLLSEINQRKYRLNVRDGVMLVERGRFLPLGFETYEPQTPALKSAYAPISAPPEEAFGSPEVFDDRSDLDRALFATLAGWANDRLRSKDTADFELAIAYVERAELLPGISEEQRKELRTLRADAAYRRGSLLISDVVDRMLQAKEEFESSIRLGTSHPGDAQRWIRDIDRRVAAFRDASGDHEDSASPKPKDYRPLPTLPKDQPPAAAPPSGDDSNPPKPWRL